MGSTNYRTLTKAITWETLGVLTLYGLTRDVTLSMGYIMIRTIMYFFHEKTWKKIKWGKK